MEDIRLWVEETRQHLLANREEWREKFEPRYLEIVGLYKKLLKRRTLIRKVYIGYVWFFGAIYFAYGLLFLLSPTWWNLSLSLLYLLLVYSSTWQIDQANKGIAKLKAELAILDKDWDEVFNDMILDVLDAEENWNETIRR